MHWIPAQGRDDKVKDSVKAPANLTGPEPWTNALDFAITGKFLISRQILVIPAQRFVIPGEDPGSTPHRCPLQTPAACTGSRRKAGMTKPRIQFKHLQTSQGPIHSPTPFISSSRNRGMPFRTKGMSFRTKGMSSRAKTRDPLPTAAFCKHPQHALDPGARPG